MSEPLHASAGNLSQFGKTQCFWTVLLRSWEGSAVEGRGSVETTNTKSRKWATDSNSSSTRKIAYNQPFGTKPHNSNFKNNRKTAENESVQSAFFKKRILKLRKLLSQVQKEEKKRKNSSILHVLFCSFSFSCFICFSLSVRHSWRYIGGRIIEAAFRSWNVCQKSENLFFSNWNSKTKTRVSSWWKSTLECFLLLAFSLFISACIMRRLPYQFRIFVLLLSLLNLVM